MVRAFDSYRGISGTVVMLDVERERGEEEERMRV